MLSQARVHEGELVGSGRRHRWGTAPGGLFRCLEHQPGSHQPFLLVSPLVQDRNRQSLEVPSSRTCTHPSASSSLSSTTRQVRAPLQRWRRPAATPQGKDSPHPRLSPVVPSHPHALGTWQCWRCFSGGFFPFTFCNISASQPRPSSLLGSIPAISTTLSPRALPASWEIPSLLHAQGTETRLCVRPFA